ncbi:calmodulin-binding protein 60 E-like isoform X2 [Phragmites australis]|uniref:calmodulin-binding protein 60 E-like isoform X2 n=1 Tax=Phragmites australis TaxID=29695 RepID=UPI002D789C68|nr:calmodulin-binding protein 60 E-like isoform X2 [Phragmites australis]
MAPSKRRLPWSSSEDDAGAVGELSLPRKRWQSLVLQVRGTRRRTNFEGLFGFKEIRGEEFMSMFRSFFGSMVQRVVSEEVEKAIFRQFNAPPVAPPRLLVGWNQRPMYQLMFQNGLKPVYTMMKLEASNGTAIKVAIVEKLENNRTNIVRFDPLSSAKVEVVVLHGNFNAKKEESWTPEEFNKHIVSGREKSAQLLTGNLKLKLNGGEAILEHATFTDNSSFTSTKKFRLGLRLANASRERVLEGVTDPFRVKERRLEGFEKHYPPMLDDEVWRLEKIGKNGAYHQALSNNGIDTVQKFLQAYMKDEQKLIQIFSKMPQSTWKSIIGHAMTCKLGDGLYLYEVKNKDAVIFFDAIYNLVGVKSGDCYMPIDQLDQVEKNFVETLKQEAYQNMNVFQYSYKMVDNHPVPLDKFPAEGQHNSYLGNTSTGQGFGSRHSREKFGTSKGYSNVPVDISRFVQGHTSNHEQLRHEQIINRVLPYNSSQGALLPGPRITQLQIPNTERAYLSSDASPPADIPNSILVNQVATQFDQYRQREQSHFSEESYSCHSLNSLLSTDAVMSLMQSQFQLSRNSERFSNHSDQQCNSQTIIQPQQVVTGFQPSRTNSFDLSSCDELIKSFLSQNSNSEGASTPLSPRKWVKIRAALKLASVRRLSRASRRGPHCAPPRPRLVPTI